VKALAGSLLLKCWGDRVFRNAIEGNEKARVKKTRSEENRRVPFEHRALTGVLQGEIPSNWGGQNTKTAGRYAYSDVICRWRTDIEVPL